MKNEKLKFLRFSLLLSSISPLFLLLLIKGSNFDNNAYNLYFSLGCISILIFSFLPFWIRCFIIRKEQPITRDIENKNNISECKEKYSSYILSIVLPIYQNSINNIHDLLVLISIIIFIVIVFYIFNLYYLNIVFYLFGYKIYEIKPENQEFEKFILISYKTETEFKEQAKIKVKKITDGLFLEIKGHNNGI